MIGSSRGKGVQVPGLAYSYHICTYRNTINRSILKTFHFDVKLFVNYKEVSHIC